MNTPAQEDGQNVDCLRPGENLWRLIEERSARGVDMNGGRDLEPDMLAAALEYAKRGWPVLPLHHMVGGKECSCSNPKCDRRGKHPVVPRGLHDATTDPDTIRRWWSQHPLANIGVVTGAASGLLVIDLDGEHGRDNFYALLKKHDSVALDTLAARSGGGGYHWYFRYPEALVCNSVGKLAAGIDVRGDGGYIVAPPSLHQSSLRYEWSNDLPIAPLPEWLLELLVAPPSPPVGHKQVTSGVLPLIPEGQRNATLTSLAGTMRRRGMSAPAITAALLEENSAKCNPPLGANEVQQIAASVGRYEPEDEQDATDPSSHSERESQADKLVQMGADAELFHTPDGDAYATIEIGGHRGTWRVGDTGFRHWLTHRYFTLTGKSPNSQALSSAIGVFQCCARFDGPQQEVFVRVGSHDGAIYLDLANENWEAVEITASGWSVIKTPPVKFRRPRGLLALPTPARGGSIDALRRFINIGTESDWVLVISWLLACFCPRGPYPVLVLNGEHGAAKSTAVKVLRRLIDPNGAELRAEPRDPHDLVIAAANGWVVAIDNISRLPAWLSDALCRLATGGGFGTRELYTDDEEKLFHSQRPVALNGIEEIVTRPDLLDRAVIVSLPAISDEHRCSEEELWEEYEKQRPYILGALLDAVACAIKNAPTVRLPRLPRMADFALWATAAEQEGLGWQPGAFMDAYAGNRAHANDLALESSPVVPAIRTLIDEGAVWEGTATDLLTLLAQKAGTAADIRAGWPKNGCALSSTLRRLAPNLRACGVDVQSGKSGTRYIRLRKIASVASAAS